MAASMWRMNGPCRRMAGVLLLCAVILSNEVMCQDDPTDAPAPAADTPVMTATAAQDVVATPTAAAGGESAASAAAAASAAPQSSAFPATIVSIALDNSQDGDTSGATGTTAAPVVEAKVVPDVARILRTVVPDVICVEEEDITKSNAVMAEVATDNCEATKHMIQANPADWCDKENCNLKIFQDGNMALVASDDANLATLTKALNSDHLKDKLGVTKTETPSSSSSGSSVFVGILVSGLLAALAIVLGYLKCQRRTDTKGVRLAEEAHPADQENQGNTLVSVAPLNPPLETPEKPSINGESLEAEKTQPPPPTNGHSTTKTADTEL